MKDVQITVAPPFSIFDRIDLDPEARVSETFSPGNL
jgi:hypothetical protein